MTKYLALKDKITEFLLYNSPNGEVRIEVFLHNENVWLTQKRMAELFDVEVNTINYHLKEIFKSGELDKYSTIRKFRIVQKEGTRVIERETEFYNLDTIISVGYRVNSARATQFRIWATKILKEFIIKGFVMDDERLKNPKNSFGKDYFEEQLARIRDIRSSERRFYQKITDIYVQCSADYDSNSKITEDFFATVQNKLHWAITGQTAAEIIYARANSRKNNMGLTTWKNAPKGKIRKTDIMDNSVVCMTYFQNYPDRKFCTRFHITNRIFYTIAKNYLNKTELDLLNRIVSMYLDYAELQATNRKVMYMKDWILKLNAFLQFNEKEILQGKGKISQEVANRLAIEEYEKYIVEQDRLYESDFDKLIKKLGDKKGINYWKNSN